MEHRSIGRKDAAVARAMEFLIALEVGNRAAQMRAHRAGNSESLVAIAKYVNLFLGEKGGRAEGEVGGVADLERLRRLIIDAGNQVANHRSEADRNS